MTSIINRRVPRTFNLFAVKVDPHLYSDHDKTHRNGESITQQPKENLLFFLGLTFLGGLKARTQKKCPSSCPLRWALEFIVWYCNEHSRLLET